VASRVIIILASMPAKTWTMNINWRNVHGKDMGVVSTAFCTLPSNLVSRQTAAIEAMPMESAIQKHTLLVIKCHDSSCGENSVLKIRQPASEFKTEGTNMIRMYSNEGVAALLPPIRAFVKVTHYGKTWAGAFMDHYDMSVNAIIFPVKGFNVKKLEASFEKARPDGSSGGHGVAMRYTPSGLQTAALVACMELLQRMHSLGWVHGDTHLGNFLVNTKTWCVVAIDFERSFYSKDVGQHLMVR
jgi:hypothetical protein